MSKKGHKPKVFIIREDEQRRAITSPLRMELMGLFTDGDPLSVATIAERMGRPATAIYYHVRVLEKAGLMRRVGKKQSGRRPEALYFPVADLFKIEAPRELPEAEMSLKAMATAFRMAERDMKAAFTNPKAKSVGPYRNVFGGRMHCRLSKKKLSELNRHLRDIEKLLSRAHSNHEPSPDDSFVSFTVALMPLRNREA
jgi:DNA-binding transcriptional ArsR family regulator